MLSPFDESGHFLVAGIDPATKLIGYGGVIRVSQDLLADGGDVEAPSSYVEDEANEGIKLLLSEVRAHLVDAVLGVADVLVKKLIGFFSVICMPWWTPAVWP